MRDDQFFKLGLNSVHEGIGASLQHGIRYFKVSLYTMWWGITFSTNQDQGFKGFAHLILPNKFNELCAKINFKFHQIELLAWNEWFWVRQTKYKPTRREFYNL